MSRLRSLVVSRAGGRLCALPLERVLESMRPPPATPLPDAPSFVLGVARIRGAAVPVDLGTVLGQRGHRGRSLLTLRLNDSVVALAMKGGRGEITPEALVEEVVRELRPTSSPASVSAPQATVGQDA